VSEGLAPEWVLWAAENLLSGAAPATVARALAEGGVPPEIAEAQIAAIRAAPAYDGLRRRLVRGRMLERFAAVRLAHRDGLAVLPDVDLETFHRAYWVGGQPLVLTDAIHFAALRWTFAGLAERYGEVEVEVNTGRTEARRRSHVEREATRTTFGALLRELDRPGNDRYAVSRNGLLAVPGLAPLAADRQPLPPFLDAGRPLPSLWVGPAGTRTDWHYDTHDVLLVQVLGRKRFAIASPEHPAWFEDTDGFYATAEVEADHVVELAPGQALFLPVGWWHRVDALEPSITATFLGFRWPNDWHAYRPDHRT